MRGELVAGFTVLVLTIAALFLIAALVKGPIDQPDGPLDTDEPNAALVVVRL